MAVVGWRPFKGGFNEEDFVGGVGLLHELDGALGAEAGETPCFNCGFRGRKGVGEKSYVFEAGHGEGLHVVTRRVHCCVRGLICQKGV